MQGKGEKPFSEEGYAFMGACFEVHREQGGGLLEEIYQESLELELGVRKIPFVSKQELATFYKGVELKKRYIPDLVVFQEIIAELKSVSALTSEHEAQAFELHANLQKACRIPRQFRAD